MMRCSAGGSFVSLRGHQTHLLRSCILLLVACQLCFALLASSTLHVAEELSLPEKATKVHHASRRGSLRVQPIRSSFHGDTQRDFASYPFVENSLEHHQRAFAISGLRKSSFLQERRERSSQLVPTVKNFLQAAALSESQVDVFKDKIDSLCSADGAIQVRVGTKPILFRRAGTDSEPFYTATPAVPVSDFSVLPFTSIRCRQGAKSVSRWVAYNDPTNSTLFASNTSCETFLCGLSSPLTWLSPTQCQEWNFGSQCRASSDGSNNNKLFPPIVPDALENLEFKGSFLPGVESQDAVLAFTSDSLFSVFAPESIDVQLSIYFPRGWTSTEHFDYRQSCQLRTLASTGSLSLPTPLSLDQMNILCSMSEKERGVLSIGFVGQIGAFPSRMRISIANIKPPTGGEGTMMTNSSDPFPAANMGVASGGIAVVQGTARDGRTATLLTIIDISPVIPANLYGCALRSSSSIVNSETATEISFLARDADIPFNTTLRITFDQTKRGMDWRFRNNAPIYWARPLSFASRNGTDIRSTFVSVAVESRMTNIELRTPKLISAGQWVSFRILNAKTPSQAPLENLQMEYDYPFTYSDSPLSLKLTVNGDTTGGLMACNVSVPVILPASALSQGYTYRFFAGISAAFYAAGILLSVFLIIVHSELKFNLQDFFRDVTSVCVTLSFVAGFAANVAWVIKPSSVSYYLFVVQTLFLIGLMSAVCFEWAIVAFSKRAYVKVIRTVYGIHLLLWIGFALTNTIFGRDIISCVYSNRERYSDDCDIDCINTLSAPDRMPASWSICQDGFDSLLGETGSTASLSYPYEQIQDLVTMGWLLVLALGLQISGFVIMKHVSVLNATKTAAVRAAYRRALSQYVILNAAVTIVYTVGFIAYASGFGKSVGIWPWYIFAVWSPRILPPVCFLFARYLQDTSSAAVDEKVRREYYESLRIGEDESRDEEYDDMFTDDLASSISVKPFDADILNEEGEEGNANIDGDSNTRTGGQVDRPSSDKEVNVLHVTATLRLAISHLPQTEVKVEAGGKPSSSSDSRKYSHVFIAVLPNASAGTYGVELSSSFLASSETPSHPTTIITSTTPAAMPGSTFSSSPAHRGERPEDKKHLLRSNLLSFEQQSRNSFISLGSSVPFSPVASPGKVVRAQSSHKSIWGREQSTSAVPAANETQAMAVSHLDEERKETVSGGISFFGTAGGANFLSSTEAIDLGEYLLKTEGTQTSSSVSITETMHQTSDTELIPIQFRAILTLRVPCEEDVKRDDELNNGLPPVRIGAFACLNSSPEEWKEASSAATSNDESVPHPTHESSKISQQKQICEWAISLSELMTSATNNRDLVAKANTELTMSGTRRGGGGLKSAVPSRNDLPPPEGFQPPSGSRPIIPSRSLPSLLPLSLAKVRSFSSRNLLLGAGAFEETHTYSGRERGMSVPVARTQSITPELRLRCSLLVHNAHTLSRAYLFPSTEASEDLFVIERLTESSFTNSLVCQLSVLLARSRMSQLMQAEHELQQFERYAESLSSAAGKTSVHPSTSNIVRSPETSLTHSHLSASTQVANPYNMLLDSLRDEKELDVIRSWLAKRIKDRREYVDELRAVRDFSAERQRKDILFKPSTAKKDWDLRFFPINLQTHTMTVSTKASFRELAASAAKTSGDNSTKSYPFVTVGAMCAHALKFVKGGTLGLQESLQRLEEKAETTPGGDYESTLSTRKKDHKMEFKRLAKDDWNRESDIGEHEATGEQRSSALHQNSRRRRRGGFRTWSSVEREIEDLKWDIQKRLDVSFTSALCALVTSFVACLNVAVKEQEAKSNGLPRGFRVATSVSLFLQQISEIGFLFQVESLLSTHGNEIGMLEDMCAAVARLHCCSFQIVDDEGANSVTSSAFSSTGAHPFYGNTFSNTGATKDSYSLPVSSWKAVRLRLNEKGSAGYIIQISLHRSWMEFIPSRLRNGCLVFVKAVMFTQGINEMQTIANASGAHTALQEKINVANLKKLRHYVEAYKTWVNTWRAFTTEQRVQRVKEAASRFADLEKVVKEAAMQRVHVKQVEILTLSSDLCRYVLAGGRCTCCKSAKDRTSMSVTFEQARILRDRHRLPRENMQETVDVMRSHGVRLENAKRNTGKPAFAFNKFQRALLPKAYKAPAVVSGANVS